MRWVVIARPSQTSPPIFVNNALATLTIDRDKVNASASVLTSCARRLFGFRCPAGLDDLHHRRYHKCRRRVQSRRLTPERLNAIRVRAKNGTLVPLSAPPPGLSARPASFHGQPARQLPAVTISYNLPPVWCLATASIASTRQGTDRFAEGARPRSSAPPRPFQDSLANQGLLITGAILARSIMCSASSMSFIHLLTILTGLPPSAAVGALEPQALRHDLWSSPPSAR